MKYLFLLIPSLLFAQFSVSIPDQKIFADYTEIDLRQYVTGFAGLHWELVNNNHPSKQKTFRGKSIR